MLTRLYLKHFAVIEMADIDFSKGMTVLTGETGAGKSVLMDALSLAVGGRANSRVIRAGEASAQVAASFDLSGLPPAKAWLVERGFEAEDDACLLRRQLTQEGRSKAFINGTPATVRQLSEIGTLLINLHQQQAHQQLLGRAMQLVILDDFGQHQAVCHEVRQLHDQCRAIQARIEQCSGGQEGEADRLALLEYQLSELVGVELEQLAERSTEHQRLAGAKDSRGLAEETVYELSESELSAAGMLQRHAAQLRQIADQDERLQAGAALIAAAGVHLSEAMTELSRYLSSVNEDPKRLEALEAYFETVHRLARKHKVAPEALEAHRETLVSQKEALAGTVVDLEGLQAKQVELEGAYDAKASQLSTLRAQSATKIAAEVTALLASLGMKGGSFRVALETAADQRRATGIDGVRFLISGGAGQPLGLLDEVASGGELSRISIAIQLVTTGSSLPPTVVFDEADAGIGGQTAAQVGALLKRLATKTQVICATHLPQVAVFGNQHLYAEKGAEEDGLSSLTQLSDEARRAEIARMLDGDASGQKGLAHADEMLARVVCL